MKHRHAFALLPLVALGLALSTARAAPPEDDAPPVELVAFGSLQCPYTARADATLAKLQQQYGAKLVIRWVHRPLAFHTRAVDAARAVEAATSQGARVPMVRAILGEPRSMQEADFIRHAHTMDLDMARFKRDLADPSSADAVARDSAAADNLAVTATPTFFINGKRLSGAQPIDKFTALIDEEDAAVQQDGTNATARTRLNNAPLAGYLYDGITPQRPLKIAGPEVPETPTKTIDPAERVHVPVDVKRDGILGPTYAPVTFVVFTDYMCPFCRKYDDTLEALRRVNPTRVRVVIKHRPLPFHRGADTAAAAALCAREAGQTFFARMHTMLMAASTRETSVETYVQMGKEAGLDAKELRACMTSAETARALKVDTDLADKVQARGTPTTFVNGLRIAGARPLTELKAIVEAATAEAEAKLPHDIEQDAVYKFLTSE